MAVVEGPMERSRSVLFDPLTVAGRLVAAVVGLTLNLTLLAPAACSATDTPTTQEIPLSEIWALDMPGTRPMNRSRTQKGWGFAAPEGRWVEEIRQALPAAGDAVAGPGFVVPGRGMPALRAAHAVLAGGRPRRNRVAAGRPATLVFFARELGSYVHLRSVTYAAHRFAIDYRFVPHMTKEMTVHLALIPLPNLRAGRYDVDVRGEIEQPENTPPSPGSADRWSSMVAGPFSFTVEP